MLTETMSHEEVIHEIEKDLDQVWNYFYKKDFEKILKKKIGKRKIQDPIQYVESYTSKNKIEWGIHIIAVDRKEMYFAIYALHRNKSGLAAYKTMPKTSSTKWHIYTSHFYDQYYKRFLQYEFNEPLHKKEIIQEYMLYTTDEYCHYNNNDELEGLLTESSRKRMLEEGTKQMMGAIDDGVFLGVHYDTYMVFTTFISFDMVLPHQERLVDMLKRGLALSKKGIDPSNFAIDKGRRCFLKEHKKEILLFHYQELVLGTLREDPNKKNMTEEEALEYLEKASERAEKRRKAEKLYEDINLDFKPTNKLFNLGK